LVSSRSIYCCSDMEVVSVLLKIIVHPVRIRLQQLS
jgi:hypothetical protein